MHCAANTGLLLTHNDGLPCWNLQRLSLIHILQRLVAEDTYPIQGSTCQTNSSGKLPLEEPWIHATGSIVEVGDNIATWNVCGFSPAILDPNAPQNQMCIRDSGACAE